MVLRWTGTVVATGSVMRDLPLSIELELFRELERAELRRIESQQVPRRRPRALTENGPRR